MSNSEQKFLYSVNPKKVIKTLKNGPVIKTAKSIELNKDDVRECLKYGVVYRRFEKDKRIERVTILNVDRLHNTTFMTEDEYKLFLDNQIGNTGNVKIPEVIINEEVVPPVNEVVEPVKKEETIEDIVVDEPVVVTEESSIADQVVEDAVETAEETKKEPQYNPNRNYNGKNKHR